MILAKDIVSIKETTTSIFNVNQVNKLCKIEGKWRTASKPVSFALQYQGTWTTLVKNCGFSVEEAKSIEANYHTLYEVSKKWVDNVIETASKQGYYDMAFGLRLRTPTLGSTIMNTDKTPYKAFEEARTLGNAASGQSYGLLNDRALSEFMEIVWADPKLAMNIRPCMKIHDAGYLRVKPLIDVVDFVNREYIRCMAWQELPELQHPDIKIKSELSIFWPTWADETTIPNGSSKEKINEICENI